MAVDNYEQRVSAVKEGIISNVNSLKQEGNENPEGIKNINELMNKEFLNNLSPDMAESIVTTIDKLAAELKQSRQDLPKDLKDLKDFLDPIVNKNKIKGFKNLNPMQSNDLYHDIDKNDARSINNISNQITKLKGKLTAADKDIKDILDKIDECIKNLSPATEDQLKQFLLDNKIVEKIESRNDLLQGIQKFLGNIEQHVTDMEEKARVVNKLDNNQKRFQSFFDAIKEGNWANLDDFKKAREEIKAFINQNPRNTSVIDAYISMKKQNQETVGDGSIDRKVFRDVFECLDSLYGEKGDYRDNAAERYWNNRFDEVFNSFDKNIIKFATNGLGLTNWNGDNLGNGIYETEIEKACLTLQGQNFNFDAKYFIENFNKKNQERKDNNADLLGKVIITDKIDLSQITYDKTTEKLLLKKGDNKTEELTKSNLSKELQITDATIGSIGGTNFVNGEMNNVILKDEKVQEAWLTQIKQKKKDGAPTEGGDVEPEPSEGLNINPENIKITLKYGVNEDEIAGVINGLGNEEKSANADKIKSVIAALQNDEKIPGRSGNISIQNLQNTMNDVLVREGKITKKLVPDGKLGKNTLYVMKLYIGASVDNKDKLNYEVSRGRLSQRQQGIYDAYLGYDGQNTKGLTDAGISCNAGEDPFDRVMEQLDTTPNGYRNELSKLVEGKNFPGKDIIAGNGTTKGLLQDHDKLKSIQLQLVPHYKGHIDGSIGPLTVRAVEDYISANDKSADSSNNGSEIVKKSDANLVRLDSAGHLNATGDSIKTVIDKDSQHAYFLEGDDFTYETDPRKTEIKATVTKAKNAPMNYRFTNGTLTDSENNTYNSNNINLPNVPQDIKNMFNNMQMVLNKL